MSHLTKNFIRSSCRQILKNRTTAAAMLDKATSLSNSADALNKMLIDAGVPEAEIGLTMNALKDEPETEAPNKDAVQLKHKAA